jgi:hypothetical protein
VGVDVEQVTVAAGRQVAQPEVLGADLSLHAGSLEPWGREIGLVVISDDSRPAHGDAFSALRAMTRLITASQVSNSVVWEMCAAPRSWTNPASIFVAP